MQIHTVEQGTPEWLALRLGIPTASEFKNLVTPTGKAATAVKSYALTLAAERFIGEPVDAFTGNAATERGHELEPAARRFYEFSNDVEAVQVGFVTSDDKTVGCSPDSLIGEDGLLEIKCPLAPKFMECLKYVHEGKCPPDYFIQVQGQMFVCERKWCDLLFYHPQLPPRHIRVFPDAAIVETLQSQLTKLAELRSDALAMLTDQKEAA